MCVGQGVNRYITSQMFSLMISNSCLYLAFSLIDKVNTSLTLLTQKLPTKKGLVKMEIQV